MCGKLLDWLPYRSFYTFLVEVKFFHVYFVLFNATHFYLRNVLIKQTKFTICIAIFILLHLNLNYKKTILQFTHETFHLSQNNWTMISYKKEQFRVKKLLGYLLVLSATTRFPRQKSQKLTCSIHNSSKNIPSLKLFKLY